MSDVPLGQVFEIVGELTIHTAAERKAALTALLESGARLDIVLSQVTELDTAGLQLLLLAKREAAQLGKTLRFGAPSQAVTDVLAIARLSGELDDLSLDTPPHLFEEVTR